VRLGGVGQFLAEEIERRTGYEARYVILGYIQRGGSPTAFDRVLGTRFGIAAIDLVHQGKFGQMVCLHGNSIKSLPIIETIGKPKLVDEELYGVAEAFFG
jgi:6-phosphofructokinase 1